MSDDLLFVYGTLRKKSDSSMYRFLQDNAELIGTGSYQGKLYVVDYYPGAIPSDDERDQVLGELFRVADTDKVFAKLDEYEECQPGADEPTEYIRGKVEIHLDDGTRQEAWTYIYNWPVDDLPLIESGDFFKRA